jgi:hypothetical protein
MPRAGGGGVSIGLLNCDSMLNAETSSTGTANIETGGLTRSPSSCAQQLHMMSVVDFMDESS